MAKGILNILFHALIGLGLLYIVVRDVGPVVEGYFLPVVAEISITKIRAYDEEKGTTIFAAKAKKLRTADWFRTQFHLGKRYGPSVPVDTNHLGQPRLNDKGFLYWDRIEVRLTPDQLLTNSYANVSHSTKDWWRFWSIISHYYDSETHTFDPAYLLPDSF